MRPGNIIKLLLSLGVYRDSIKIRGDWVNCPCPLAKYTHGNGEDINPSFGIRVNLSGESYYYCFGCSPSGQPLQKLLHNYYIASGVYPIELSKFILGSEFFSPKAAIRRPESVSPRKRKVVPLPCEVLSKYPLLKNSNCIYAKNVRDWLCDSRGIPVWVQHHAGVRYCQDRMAAVFPLTDTKNNIYVLRVRLIESKTCFTVSSKFSGIHDVIFPTIKDSGSWFGMCNIDWSDPSPLLIVEGEIDALKSIAFGMHRTIASTTSSVSDSQLNSIAASIIFSGYDSDKAGMLANLRIANKFKKRLDTIVSYIPWSSELTIDGVPCKDPGDILDDASFRNAISKRLDDPTKIRLTSA